MTTFTKEITIETSKTKVWAILSDLGGVYKFHPGVVHSYYSTDSKNGVGAARICELAPMGKIEETAVDWVEGEQYTLKLDPLEKAPPLKDAKGIVKLTEVSPNQTKVTVDLSYGVKLGIIGKMLNSLVLKDQLNKGIEGLLKGLKVYAEQGKEIKNNKELYKILSAA
tara:strand:+ start:532 stop:1032 length:501 start_codon:yes stop_codon:yes gene_type:complete